MGVTLWRGLEKLVSREAHNLEIVSSSLTPATNIFIWFFLMAAPICKYWGFFVLIG